MPSSAPPKLFPRARPSKVKLLRRPLDATRPRLGGDEMPVRAQILEGKWPPRDRNSRWVAPRGGCRRCRRRLSGFWPRRGAKPDHLFRHALRADGMAGLAQMLCCFAASCCPALPSLCRRRATRASPNKEEDAGERRKSKQMRQEESRRRRRMRRRESRRHHNNSR